MTSWENKAQVSIEFQDSECQKCGTLDEGSELR